MEQYEVWYQDGRTRKMRVVYVMASSFAEARKNAGGRPVDCRKRILRGTTWKKTTSNSTAQC